MPSFVDEAKVFQTYQRYNFESKSQQNKEDSEFAFRCFRPIKDTILKANHKLCVWAFFACNEAKHRPGKILFDRVPFVYATINGQRELFLIDTGASVSMLDKTFCDDAASITPPPGWRSSE